MGGENGIIKKEDWLLILSVIAGSILCLALSYTHINILAFSGFPNTLADELFRDLGLAGLIAMFLVLTVERVTRERHQKAAHSLMEQINKNLFCAIYKRHIPGHLFHELEKGLFSANVFRKNYRVTYTFLENTTEEGSIDPNYFKCIVESRYDLENLNEAKITHPIVFKIERPFDPAYDLQAKVTKMVVNDDNLADSALLDCTVRDNVHITFTHQITIPSKATFSIQSEALTFKRKHDTEVWASRIPSDGISLTVTHPRSLINVEATANHQQSLKLVASSPLSKTWELPHAMLPFQSIVFWWRG